MRNDERIIETKFGLVSRLGLIEINVKPFTNVALFQCDQNDVQMNYGNS